MKKQLRYLTLIICFAFAKLLSAQNYKWSNVPIGGGGFVSAIIASKTVKNLVYARTDVGGAYRWDDVNSKWIPLTDWVSEEQTGYLGVESLALDPNNDAIVYMLVGISYFNNGNTAILKSTDYGETFSIVNVSSQFKAHGNGMGRQNGEKLVVDPNNPNVLYCGTRWNGLFKSTNAGASWSRISALNVTTTPNENGISLVVLDKSKISDGNTQTMYVGVSRTGSNFYKTSDGGQTFTELSGGPTDLMPQRASLASDGNLYITYADGAGPHGHWSLPEPMENGQVWKYNTTTGVWINVTPTGYSRAFGGVSVDSTDANRIVISTINTYLPQDNAYGDRVLISTNGGTSWTDVMANGVDIDPNGVTWIDGNAIHWAGSIEFDPFNAEKVWITSGNGIFVNDDIAASPSIWRFEVNGLEETVPLDIESVKEGPLVSVIGDYDGFTHVDVSTYAPIHAPEMGTTSGLDIAELNTDIRLRVGNDMYYTMNGGTSWTKCTINGVKGRVAISADGATFLHSPEQASVTYFSTNKGSSWATSSGININEAKPTADPINVNKFYAYNPSNGTMYVSIDKGVSFSAAGNAGTNGSKIIRLNPEIEGDIWIAMYNGGLKHSTNSGQSFTTINGVSQCGAVGLGKAVSGADYPTVYIWGTVGGMQGLYSSIDKGISWTRINDDAHQYGGPGNGQFVIGDWNEYGRVYMSTAGRGIVTGYVDGVDCKGVINGTAFVDNCGECAGGTTGVEPNSTCDKDCNDGWGGTAEIDDCNKCTGGTTGVTPNSSCPQPCNIPVTNDTICEAGDVGFVVSGNYSWYETLEGGTPFYKGTYYSERITENKSFFIESEETVNETIGLTTQGETGWGDNTFANADKQIKIIVSESSTLNAVHVFTTVAGTDVTLNIIDFTTSEVKKTVTRIGLEVGKQRIPMDVLLAPGTYLISAEGTTESLFYQSADGEFPYGIPNVFEFTFNVNWASEWYGMFYEWEITVGASCVRTEVKGIIDPTSKGCVINSFDDNMDSKIVLYPNPTTNSVTINGNIESIWRLYDSHAKLVMSGRENHILLAGYPSGIYMLILGNQSYKVVKE